MRPIRDRSSTITWQSCFPTSKPKSSGAPIRPQHSSYCQSAGLLNAPSPGSTVVEDLPRTGRTSIARASLSCASPQSASCYENSVIPLDVLGQTLRIPFLGANQIQGCFLGGSLGCDGPVGIERRSVGADGAADHRSARPEGFDWARQPDVRGGSAVDRAYGRTLA